MKHLPDIMEVVGFAAVLAGLWWVSPPMALVVGGVGLVLVAQVQGRRG